MKQECIPVGCVPPAAVAIRRGLDQIPLNFPLGCGPGGPPWPDPPKLPPWVWAWKSARHAGTRPPWDQTPPRTRHPPGTEFLTHPPENITLPQTSFVGSKYNYNKGQAWLIQSHSSARFSFELSGNLN